MFLFLCVWWWYFQIMYSIYWNKCIYICIYANPTTTRPIKQFSELPEQPSYMQCVCLDKIKANYFSQTTVVWHWLCSITFFLYWSRNKVGENIPKCFIVHLSSMLVIRCYCFYTKQFCLMSVYKTFDTRPKNVRVQSANPWHINYVERWIKKNISK